MAVDIEFHPFDAGFVPARGMHVNITQIELLQLIHECIKRNSQIKHRTDEHVAADAAEDIEI